jgi:predicted lipoprotein
VKIKSSLPTIIAAAVLLALCWAFPPFHIRSLKETQAAHSNAQFNSTNFVERFWTEKLIPAAERATDASKVLEAIEADPAKAREQFGRSVGISSSFYFFLRGAGRIVRVTEDEIGLSLRSEGDAVDISIPLGLVFGNAVRDATGLLDSSNYPNAQEFNDISANLNLMVENNVLPELQRIAKVGARVQFAGSVEVADDDEDLKPLKLVPVLIKTE